MKVAEWIRQHPGLLRTVAPEVPKEDVATRMLAEPARRDVYVVSTDGQVLGHISHKKMAALFLAEHCPVHTRRQIIARVTAVCAEDLMDGCFPSAGLEEELDAVLYRQLEHDVEDLPVLDEEGLVLGMVNLSAVIKEYLHAG